MDTVAQKEVVGQEEKELQKVEEYLTGIQPEKFWEELTNTIRNPITTEKSDRL